MRSACPTRCSAWRIATQYAVVEMGMSHLGEIARLVRAARPSAGIITMIGVSHLENLGTRRIILKAKMEICQGLPDAPRWC